MLEQISSGNLGALGSLLREHSVAMASIVAVALLLFFSFSQLISGGSKGGPSPLVRAGEALARAFTTNWQLTLLATTALVLSLASGWTTWDGMRNFTGEPVLSLMVTFGIQGVMLIIAWLIGETFATGMGQRSRGRDNRDAKGAWSQIEPLVGMLVGGLCAIGILTLFASWIGAFDDFRAASSGTRSWQAFADKALYLGVGLLLVATLLINQRNEIIQPYLQSARVMLKSAVLWVMFLSCMATSVFFSFDSLFSSIFPQSERKRAADIRAVRQVAGAVADIGSLAQQRLAEEGEALFRADGWKAFEKNLDALSRSSQGAEQEIERYFVEQMEQRNQAISVQKERISSANSSQAGLDARKATITDEVSRLKAERPGLAAEVAEKKTELDSRSKLIDAKRVEAMAEERGAEGTLKVGRGPMYRQRMDEMARMQDAIKIQDERVRDATKRLAANDTRVAQLSRELAAVDGDIAKLKGEAQTAEQRIAVAETSRAGEESGPKIDPGRVRAAFERAHGEFRQAPTAEHLNALATQCSQLLNAMAATPATKERVRAIDCDPKPAAEAASHVFALNTGLVVFAQNCTGGDKLPASGGTDAMLNFGRKCLQDSGLPSKDSNEMAARISSIDLNRDDKAHRFVVTWNAFADGNRLAYLALSIAIAIDGLVFMSGLFGANALRSPLTEIEDRGAMTADQLESTIEGALSQTEHPRATLSAMLSTLHPIHGDDGFTSEIVIDDREPLAGEILQVLNIARTIGAVRPSGRRGHFDLHAGFVRYLALALKKAPKLNKEHVDRKELVNVIGVALLPDPQGNAEIVLGEMHPISDSEGYAAETYPFKIEDAGHRRLVLNTLGAGATITGAVKRQNSDGRYFVSTDFYRTLLLMRAAAVPAFTRRAVEARYAGAALPSPSAMDQSNARSNDVLPTHLNARPIGQIAHQARDEHSSERSSRPEPSGQRPMMPGGSVPTPLGQPGAGVPPPVPPRVAPGDSEPRQHYDSRGAVRADGRERDTSDIVTNLGEQIRADIIHLGGLHTWTEREIDIARTLGADSEPEQALHRLASRAPKLATLVGQTIDDNRASLREAYEYLLAHHGGDAMYKQVLETVVAELDELMPLLMLSPGGPYQQILEHRLIPDLERQAGDGVLTPADDALLARARAQVTALKGLVDGASDRFVRIVRIIDQYDERQPGSPVASFEAAKAAQKRSAG